MKIILIPVGEDADQSHLYQLASSLVITQNYYAPTGVLAGGFLYTTFIIYFVLK